MNSEQPKKKQKLDESDHADPALIRVQRAAFLSSMSRDISPPLSSKVNPDTNIEDVKTIHSAKQISSESFSTLHTNIGHEAEPTTEYQSVSTQTTASPPIKGSLEHLKKTQPSPFSLTKIRDLPAANNIDTVSLHDILGNPLIKEAWVFNFCFDLDWMMQFFDPDVRDLVQVKIIHGSWRNEDSNRIAIEDACRRWPNVKNFKAYLPDQFGTHHSKMFVLFLHDDQAEVIIHTANILQKDWTNMTQAVWRSGPLCRLKKKEMQVGPVGSGTRFKHDLLAYLKEYKKLAQPLHTELQGYDFTHVRGALVASVPSKLSSTTTISEKGHLWGYLRLREVLSQVHQTPQGRPFSPYQPHLVAQVSSIASLPKEWLNTFIRATTSPPPGKSTTPSLSIIYPTASNVASSLDGYAAGGSIHTKAQLATHLTQISNLRSHLCQWTSGPIPVARAGRDTAAPHVKTYIQFDRKPSEESVAKGEVEVQWALLTSANLSTQAWGSLPRKETKGTSTGKGGDTSGKQEEGMVHIQSFEIGVLVWPDLFLDEFGKEEEGQRMTDRGAERTRNAPSMKVKIIPVFGKNNIDVVVSAQTETQRNKDKVIDTPTNDEAVSKEQKSYEWPRNPVHGSQQDGQKDSPPQDDHTMKIALRIPYDLPLTPYGFAEMPWSPAGVYMDPDSKGAVWDGSKGR